MALFKYRGTISASKSLYNRALIVQSYFPVLELEGDSQCDDVMYMRKAITEIKDRSKILCGEGGTTFRFMTLRASRQMGVHALYAAPSLMKRPHDDMIDILKQLGVQAKIKRDGLLMVSEGWKRPRKPLQVGTSISSQYASGLLLNSWLLPFPLDIALTGDLRSQSYLLMTTDFLTKMGMKILADSKRLVVPEEQRLTKLNYRVDSDVSSIFSVAALAALFGTADFLNFPQSQNQPDLAFIEIVRQMGVTLEMSPEMTLRVSKASVLKGVEANLGQCPDLFPVLAALCAFATTPSRLYGAPQLAHKESNRLEKTSELLKLMGVSHQLNSDGMTIQGGIDLKTVAPFQFHPAHDHRMVMAAALFAKAGAPIEILQRDCVNKSFPEYWTIWGGQE